MIGVLGASSPLGQLVVAELTRREAPSCDHLAPGLDADDPVTFWTYLLAAYAFDDCDDYDAAEAAIESGLGLARRRGSAVQASAACHPRAFVNLRRGRVEAALTDAQASAEGAETGWRIALPSSRALVAEAHLERGELDAAQAAAALPGGDEPWRRLISFAWMLALRGRLLLAHPSAPYAEGVFESKGTVMHVSTGTGTTFVPFRLFARPEATELVLRLP